MITLFQCLYLVLFSFICYQGAAAFSHSTAASGSPLFWRSCCRIVHLEYKAGVESLFLRALCMDCRDSSDVGGSGADRHRHHAGIMCNRNICRV